MPEEGSFAEASRSGHKIDPRGPPWLQKLEDTPTLKRPAEGGWGRNLRPLQRRRLIGGIGLLQSHSLDKMLASAIPSSLDYSFLPSVCHPAKRLRRSLSGIICSFRAVSAGVQRASGAKIQARSSFRTITLACPFSSLPRAAGDRPAQQQGWKWWGKGKAS